MTEKRLISKIYKELTQLNIKIKKQLNTKMGGRLRHFYKENINMANMYMERGSTSLITRKMQIKAKSCHLTPVRMAIIKKNTTNIGRDEDKNHTLSVEM